MHGKGGVLVLEESRSILILGEHLRKELRFVILHTACTYVEIVNRRLYCSPAHRDVILILIHKTEDVRQPLVHNLVVLLLNQILPTKDAVIPF